MLLLLVLLLPSTWLHCCQVTFHARSKPSTPAANYQYQYLLKIQ
jgi:hypothetical protein